MAGKPAKKKPAPPWMKPDAAPADGKPDPEKKKAPPFGKKPKGKGK